VGLSRVLARARDTPPKKITVLAITMDAEGNAAVIKEMRDAVRKIAEENALLKMRVSV